MSFQSEFIPQGTSITWKSKRKDMPNREYIQYHVFELWCPDTVPEKDLDVLPLVLDAMESNGELDRMISVEIPFVE